MEYAVYVYSVRYLKISSRFQMLQQMSQQIQECIPVGCVPPAH